MYKHEYRISICEPARKTLFGRSRRTRENNITVDMEDKIARLWSEFIWRFWNSKSLWSCRISEIPTFWGTTAFVCKDVVCQTPTKNMRLQATRNTDIKGVGPVVKTGMNFRVPSEMRISLTSWETVSFLNRTLPHEG